MLRSWLAHLVGGSSACDKSALPLLALSGTEYHLVHTSATGGQADISVPSPEMSAYDPKRTCSSLQIGTFQLFIIHCF